MPDTIRRSGSFARPWFGGFALAVGAFAPLPAIAEDAPRLALHELVVGASRRIDNHEIAVLVLLVGLLLFAVVTSILLLRTRARLQRLETSSHDEIAALRAGLDRANALLLTEPQVMVDWPAGSDEPIIDGDPAVVGASAPHRVLAFGSWLDAGRATAMEHAVDALRARGEPFSMAFTALNGRPIEALGRAIAGRAVLRLKDASGVKRELLDLAGRHETLLREVASLRALIERLSSPVWTRDTAGRLTFVNAAYARAVEARDAADAVERGLELLDSAARENIARARIAGGAYSGRLPAVVAGARRSFDVLDFQTETGSAGLGIDATEAESMRNALARLVDAHRRTLDRLSTGVAMFDADQKLIFYNAAYRALWNFDASQLEQRPTDSSLLEELRAANKLPEERDFRQWKAQLHAAYRALEATEQTWHLPDGRTLRVVTTPNPDGGVTYLFDDVTERLDLERRFEELIRVQGETLDNLAEGVAVFASDGRVRLFNSAFARMWGLSAANAGRAPAHRDHLDRLPAAARRRPDLAGATPGGDRDRQPRSDCRTARAARRQRHRLHHRTVAGRRHAGDVPRRDGFGECRAGAARTQRGARRRRQDQDRFRPSRVLRAALAADQHHRLRASARRSERRAVAAEAARLSGLHHRLHQHVAGADRQHPRPRHHRCRPHASQSRAGRYPQRP